MELPKDELNNYLALKKPEYKQFICQYWMRGTCLFTKDQCHNAHGTDDLDFYITHNNILRPPLNFEPLVSKLKRLDRKYYILHQVQADPDIQYELKRYFEYLGQDHQQRIYTLDELQTNKKVRSIILTFMQLKAIRQFYFKIVTLLNGQLLPKLLLFNELNRVGYSLLGQRFESHYASSALKPGTVVYHLCSSGACFQKVLDLVTKFEGKYEFSFFISKEKAVENQQLQNNQQDKEQQEKNEDDEEQQEEAQDEQIQDQNEDTSYIIPIFDQNSLNQKFITFFNQLIHENMEQIQTMANYQTFDNFVHDKIKLFNNQQDNQLNIIPSLDQYLKQTSINWEVFKKMNNLNLTFKDENDSGQAINTITQTYIPEEIEVLQNYLQKPMHKYYLCQYWLRGICIFLSKDCRFAHGYQDLEINFAKQIDIKILQESQMPLKYNQKPLIKNRSYRVLYDQQFKYFDKGLTKGIRSQFEIDSLREYRQIIRMEILREIIITIYYQYSNKKPVLKNDLMQIYYKIGLFQPGVDVNEMKTIKILQNSKVAFDKEIDSVQKENPQKNQQAEGQQNQGKQNEGKQKKEQTKITYIIPQLNFEDCTNEYTKILLELIGFELNQKQNQQLPLQETDIRKNIKKIDQDFKLPGFYKFLRMGDEIYTITSFIKKFVYPQCKAFLKDVIKNPLLYEQIQEDCSNLISFNDDFEEITLRLNKIIEEGLQKGRYIFNLSKLQKQIEQEFIAKQGAFQNNDKLKTLIRQQIYEDNKQVLLVTYYGQTSYAIFGGILQTKAKIKACKCQNQYFQNFDWNPLYNEQLIIENIQAVQPFVDPEVRNTIIIDNLDKLQLFLPIVSLCNYISVDIEGRLTLGDIWLLQVGIAIQDYRLIFIFDLMKIRYLDKNEELYDIMIAEIRKAMDDSHIVKVLHDGKKDSQALHLNAICPKNVVDTSVTCCLIEYLKINQKFRQGKQNVNQLFSLIEKVKTPPLNEVLAKYHGKYGINQLKEEMHEKFRSNNNYFFKRPNKEFMEYSARDVEDLVEVYLNMEQELQQYTSNYIIKKLSQKNLEYFL